MTNHQLNCPTNQNPDADCSCDIKAVSREAWKDGPNENLKNCREAFEKKYPHWQEDGYHLLKWEAFLSGFTTSLESGVVKELVDALEAMWKHFGDLEDNEMLAMPCKKALQKASAVLAKVGR